MGNQDGDIGLRHAVPTCGMRGYHRPRSKEDTHPDRISPVRNVATPMGSNDGRPIARAAESPSGHRTVQEANVAAPKGNGNP